MKFYSLSDAAVVKPYTDSKLNALGQTLFTIGEEALRTKSLGVVILSGGQGTRLGFSGPKGLYKIHNRTLFDWHIDRISSLRKKYNANIRVFVMTSSFTDSAVRAYLMGKDIECFVQEDVVCTDFNNNPLQFYDSVAKAPNGNGNVFKALKQVNYHNLDVINIVSVDNILASILDPVFVGAYFRGDYEVLSKSVTAYENEKVGIFAYEMGVVVKEYCEMNGNELASTSSSGVPEKKLYQGNICNHLFGIAAISRLENIDLPLHDAVKKIPYTKNGQLVEPEEPNGIKKETFIFDSFKYVSRCGIMNVPRETEFSPLKNGLDCEVDNPLTCQKAIERILFKSTL